MQLSLGRNGLSREFSPRACRSVLVVRQESRTHLLVANRACHRLTRGLPKKGKRHGWNPRPLQLARGLSHRVCGILSMSYTGLKASDMVLTASDVFLLWRVPAIIRPLRAPPCTTEIYKSNSYKQHQCKPQALTPEKPIPGPNSLHP